MRLYISIIIALVTFCILGITNEWARSKDAQKWPTVKGMVASAVKLPHNQFSDSDYRITYYYTVDKRTYSSETFRVYGAIKKDFDKYKQGTTVTVHYNPQNPETAFVETELNQENIYKQMFALAVVAFLVMALTVVRRKPTPAADSEA